MIEITITEKPDFSIVRREGDGLEVISNRTGNVYSLIHGDVLDKNGKSYWTDIMFIMLMEFDEEEQEYIFADDGFVDYIFGAEFIYQFDEQALRGVFEYIRKYEDNLE